MCDGRDNDCDAEVDEGETISVFIDDMDGWGFGATLIGACGPWTGTRAYSETVTTVIPPPTRGRRMAYDGVDADCAGTTTTMMMPMGTYPVCAGAVTDGVDGSGLLPAGDCDDTDPGVHPGVEEIDGDGVDRIVMEAMGLVSRVSTAIPGSTRHSQHPVSEGFKSSWRQGQSTCTLGTVALVSGE